MNSSNIVRVARVTLIGVGLAFAISAPVMAPRKMSFVIDSYEQSER